MTGSQRETSTDGTPVPRSDFGRIIELCDALQQYEMNSRQWDSYAAMYLEAKEQSEVAEGQVPPVLDVEIQRAVDLFPSVEKRIRRYASGASELIDRLVMHRIVGLLPSIAHCRIRGMPPHDSGYFDWQAFSLELLAVRDEATRRNRSEQDKRRTAKTSGSPPESTLPSGQTQEKTGYLGIVLDPDKRIVSREGSEDVSIPLTDLLWKLFIKFVRAEAVGVSADQLKQSDSSPSALNTAICTLRREITGLGLNITDGRGNRCRILISTSETSDDDVSGKLTI